MKNLPVLFLSILILAACGDDDNQLLTGRDNFGTTCWASEDLEDLTLGDCPIIFDSTLYCELNVIDGSLPMLQQGADWLPFYCLNEGDVLYYTNAAGESTSLLLTLKKRTLVGSIASQVCEQDSTKRIGYCYKKEHLEMTFLDGRTARNLDIDLTQSVFDPLNTSDKIFFISITNLIAEDGMLNFINHLGISVGDDNIFSFETDFARIQYWESIELLGETFTEVYEYENKIHPEAMVMYYNKTFGLVGFEDETGVLWKLN